MIRAGSELAPTQQTFVELPGVREKAYGKCPVLLVLSTVEASMYTQTSHFN